MRRKYHDESCDCVLDAGHWYRRHAAMIWRFIFVQTQDREFADDCTSETFLRAVRRSGSFRCEGDGVRPWLVTIARNALRDRLKKRSHRLEILTPSVRDDTDSDADPANIVMEREGWQELHRHIDTLSEDQARCLRLRFLGERTVAETASAMQRADIAIRGLQYRAICKLAALSGGSPGVERSRLESAGRMNSPRGRRRT
ncbi:RNA polymerase sigma factor [Haloechinothrix alba]|nr:sigma-70 family RNA polymerase sigma factor [Haloechinothrix alba]